MHVLMTIYVVYDSATVPDKEVMKANLVKSLERAVGDGLLTPTGTEVIDEYGFDEDDIVINADD
jgi:hypothetical protein